MLSILNELTFKINCKYSTERMDRTQTMYLFQRNGSKHKQTKPNVRASLFRTKSLFSNIITGMFNYICQFII